MAQQVTKDCAFESTRLRNWFAAFQWPPTTAFDDRDTFVCDPALTQTLAGVYGVIGIDSGMYLWSRNGNKACTQFSGSVFDDWKG
jgi:hypothetical protein